MVIRYTVYSHNYACRGGGQKASGAATLSTGGGGSGDFQLAAGEGEERGWLEPIFITVPSCTSLVIRPGWPAGQPGHNIYTNLGCITGDTDFLQCSCP